MEVSMHENVIWNIGKCYLIVFEEPLGTSNFVEGLLQRDTPKQDFSNCNIKRLHLNKGNFWSLELVPLS